MARIVGVDIPNNKQVPFSLTKIFGIGLTKAKEICDLAKVKKEKKVSDLNENELAAIRDVILKQGYTIEGELRREISMNIKRKIEIGCYQGIRHRRNLPVRGQRTKTNARTRKGPRKTIANKKVEAK